MKWKRSPTEAGYYWVYEDLPLETADVLLVRVWRRPSDTDWKVSTFYSDTPFVVEDFSHWMGPLTEPKPPSWGR